MALTALAAADPDDWQNWERQLSLASAPDVEVDQEKLLSHVDDLLQMGTRLMADLSDMAGTIRRRRDYKVDSLEHDLRELQEKVAGLEEDVAETDE